MKYLQTSQVTLRLGDAIAELRDLPDECVDAVITSPPYFQMCDYRVAGQGGLEDTLGEYLLWMRAVFNEVYRVMSDRASLWLIIGDTYNNYSPIRAKGQRRGSGQWLKRRSRQALYREKELLEVPSRLVEQLRSLGFIHRNRCIWDKISSGQQANSDTAVTTHEYVFHLGKYKSSGRPYLNTLPMRSSVLTYAPANDPVHPCPLPEGLVRELLRSTPGEVVLDPFVGCGTTAVVARQLDRKFIGIDLSRVFLDRAIERLEVLMNAEVVHV